MSQDDWSKIEEYSPEIAAELQRVVHFLELVDRGLESRRGRLQRALGAQHFVLSGEMKSLLLLTRSGAWLGIPSIAASIFRIAIEGVYLAEHPSRVNDFVNFNWYENQCDCPPAMSDDPFAELLKGIREEHERKRRKLELVYQDRISWHGHDEKSLAHSVNMAHLLPLYYSSIRCANGSPVGLMSIGKGGALLFDRLRERYLPVIGAIRGLYLARLSMYHFYKAVLHACEVSNEMILRTLDEVVSDLSDGVAGIT